VSFKEENMKNTIRLFGLIAIVAVIGLSMTACDDGNGNLNNNGNSNDNNNGNSNDNSNGNDDGITYIVSYNAMGAIGTPPPDAMTVKAGSSITLHNGNGFSKSGYIFTGWYTSVAGTTTYYNAGSSYVVTRNVTFYANWAITYTITFNINNGTGANPSSQTVISGTNVTLPTGSGFYKTRFIFTGWNSNNTGTGTNYNAGSIYTVNSNVTLYAKWDADVIGTWKGEWRVNDYYNGTRTVILRSNSTYTRSETNTFTGNTNTYNGTYTVTGSTISFFEDWSDNYTAQSVGIFNSENDTIYTQFVVAESVTLRRY
jgi:uncharacterized repeat protein (TIGR02543 family)